MSSSIPSDDGRPVYLSSDDAARYLALSVPTLKRYRYQGKGPAYSTLGPRRVVYAIADLDAWVAANRVVTGGAR